MASSEKTDPSPYVSYVEFSKAMRHIEHRLTRVEVIASLVSPILTAILLAFLLRFFGVA